MPNIGLLVQIANFNVWNKLKFIINNFDENIILMLHLNEVMLNELQIIDIKKEFPNAIFTYGENKGMDIYGFFLQIEYIIKNNIQLDYICKIHTKTDDKWTNDMINPLCGTKESVLNCINKFNDKVGMIGPKKYVRLMDHYNTPLILNLFKEWNIKNTYIDEIDWKEKKKLHLFKTRIVMQDPVLFKRVEKVLGAHGALREVCRVRSVKTPQN